MTTRLARYRVSRGLLGSPLLLALGMSAHAQVTPKAAAPEDTALQEVVVTGSRIARPEFDNLEPTTSVDSKTFDQRGYLDVGQALNELPAFGVSPSSAANTQAGFGVAQSFVDLYGYLLRSLRIRSSLPRSESGSPRSASHQTTHFDAARPRVARPMTGFTKKLAITVLRM